MCGDIGDYTQVQRAIDGFVASFGGIDIARTVAFLASDQSDYMTGQAINVTGGVWMH